MLQHIPLVSMEDVWIVLNASAVIDVRPGFSDLEDFWDDLRVSRLEVVWKSSGSRLDFLEVVWTSRKSSGLPGSRLDFQEVV
ncbi:hypothetical protein YC2023_046873 [Brassica napus]